MRQPQTAKKIIYDIDPIEMVEGSVKSVPTSTDAIIHQNSGKSQELFSDRDSDGHKLSDGQKEYFSRSKSVTEDGKLKVMYTPKTVVPIAEAMPARRIT